MLNWVQRFNIFCFLDSQQYKVTGGRYEVLLAAGAAAFISSEQHSFSAVDAFIKNAWTFGHLSYDLKNNWFPPKVSRTNKIGFADFFFFQPQILLLIKEGQLYIEAENTESVYEEIMQQPNLQNASPLQLPVKQSLSKKEYIEIIHQLQKHILLGDCYEINFCQEFFVEDVQIEPAQLFQRLLQVSPNPFSSFYRCNDQYLLCASPERFLSKNGNQLIAQPIKGTAPRNPDNAVDEKLKEQLYYSEKDRAENVMIVDLMRNDLSTVCEPGSVKVDELYGIYTYPQVHQMISTISGQLKKDCQFSDIIAHTFPMGSMTGAPKKKVLELIDEYEPISRGLFSGSVGYCTPYGDFDFNVVIRSILYNRSTGYLSYPVGSGITFYSDAASEWEECLWKAAAIKKVLTTG